MSSVRRVAVVTGSNTGIGYEIVRILGQHMTTVLTSRNIQRGQAALNNLKQDNPSLNAVFHQLDIDDSKSVSQFVSWMQSEFGHVDVLVNNAAIAFKGSDPTPFAGQTAPTLRTNVYNTMSFTEQMLPLLTAGDSKTCRHLVFVASQSGTSALRNSSQALQARWRDPQLTKEGVYQLLTEFTTAVGQGRHREAGFPSSNYGMSKLAVIGLTKCLARELAQQRILVNACCPGHCQTNMSSHTGRRSAATGAIEPARLAMLPSDGPTGGMWKDQQLLW